MDVTFGQGADRMDIILYVLVAAGKTDLDVVVDIDAFNAQNLQTSVLHRLL